MLRFIIWRRGYAALCLAAGAVQAAAHAAEPVPPGAAPTALPRPPAVRCAAEGSDPLDTATPVPRLRYESAFAAYRRLGEPTVASWREANDEVGRIGGWRAYARETAQAAPSFPSSADHPGCDDAPLPEGGQP
ncbi:hypothetical protein PIGHUM_04576 [Pigmentiphaga humi]|uniref:Uncharacterized protein n=1 Tax=Pigmentiphaga humi TaxID=2478468 RepID=A0A3P4B832_9BURK|nr:hypothetical protein [Pigmentiphaga humi]VCU72477.1 hypothetical protein PIGHUM_04576 [Pigmentiphaga humi]